MIQVLFGTSKRNIPFYVNIRLIIIKSIIDKLLHKYASIVKLGTNTGNE